MSATVPTIRSVKARAVVAPIARPVKNAFGVIRSAPLVLIDVATDQGITGRAYIFAYTRLTLAPLVRLIADIGSDLAGKAIAPFDLMAQMDAKFRLLGWQGLVGMAVSGLDMAFWDVLGQAAGQPLAKLLGGSPRPIRAYDSYGAVDPVTDEKDLRRSLDQGFRGIKIKGGDGDLANDERVVDAVRGLIGPDIALMLDFNQSLDPAEASRRMPDLMKVGGVTGWLRVAGQAEAASIPMSSHLFAEASSHMLAVTPTAHWIEYLDLARAIVAEPVEIVDGTITARGHGLGLSWDEAAVAKYLVH